MTGRAILTGCNELKAKLKSLTRPKQPMIVVGYQDPKAIYVHEIVDNYHEPPTQAKYLEEPVKLLRPSIAQYVKDRLKKKIQLEKVLLEAGNLLLEASKPLVPVDTGALKDSGFVEVER